MARLHVKGWRSFQHYKDRSPAWIKLHRDILDDYDFAMLPLASKALAPLVWLLASDSEDGSIDADVKKIAFRLRWSDADVAAGLKPLIDAGFLIDASGVLAECYQDACLEERRGEEYREEKRESRGDARAARKSSQNQSVERPESVPETLWNDFVQFRKQKRAPITKTALDGFAREARNAGVSLSDAIRLSIERNWQGFKAEWINNAQQGRKPASKMTMAEALMEAEHGKRDDDFSEFDGSFLELSAIPD